MSEGIPMGDGGQWNECSSADAVDPINEIWTYIPKKSLMRPWTPVDILGAIINGAVDIYGHVWATINGSMDTQVLSLMGPWTSRCCH
jgi:hypothetical protein